jgi:hypothetical protein
MFSLANVRISISEKEIKRTEQEEEAVDVSIATEALGGVY